MRVCIAASVGGAAGDVVLEDFFGGILKWYVWNKGGAVFYSLDSISFHEELGGQVLL